MSDDYKYQLNGERKEINKLLECMAENFNLLDLLNGVSINIEKDGVDNETNQ